MVIGYAVKHKYHGFLCVSGAWSINAYALKLFTGIEEAKDRAKKVSEFHLAKVVIIKSIEVEDL
ncbi:hypothetical protein LCGC14_2196650 [marine sediment metagenome]|uniref:Uncharacterized protein n=1 Tax=marine sediment metagenome TaxID=412755 RepID=A0A0F9DI57_9ZZZZ